MKIGRNDTCWCGSGKKYKKCHLGRESEPEPTKQEVITKFRKPLSKEYCLHPSASTASCKGDIVKAHTIQRNGGLSKIAENGHVLNLTVDFKTPPANPTLLVPKPTGVRLASTFTGFCNLHDTKTFEPIEKFPFQATEEHTFLLGYRALCRELFGKRAQHELLPFKKSLDRGRPITEQVSLQHYLKRYGAGVEAGLRDAEYHKAIYDKVLLSGDYSDAQYYVVFFSNTPDIMCSAAKFPTHDFNGNLLQDLGQLSKTLDQITFSIIATDTGGAAVFNWVGHSDPCERLVRSLDSLSDDDIPHAIVRFAFEYFENVYFSPTWWEGLEGEAKKKLQLRTSMAVDVNIARDRDCLVDDGLKPVSWGVESRHIRVI